LIKYSDKAPSTRGLPEWVKFNNKRNKDVISEPEKVKVKIHSRVWWPIHKHDWVKEGKVVIHCSIFSIFAAENSKIDKARKFIQMLRCPKGCEATAEWFGYEA